MTPLPGKPVRGSRTGRPIMALLDLLGRRWILRMLWELRDESLGFRALQARCGQMSPSVLSQRLRDLQATGLAGQETRTDYHLTDAGRALVKALLPLHQFAEDWAKRSGVSSQPADRSLPKKRSARRSRADSRGSYPPRLPPHPPA
jgi:DNA-binding HxlR family transcriptional regulator